jgi:hypothetical protein
MEFRISEKTAAPQNLGETAVEHTWKVLKFRCRVSWLTHFLQRQLSLDVAHESGESHIGPDQVAAYLSQKCGLQRNS